MLGRNENKEREAKKENYRATFQAVKDKLKFGAANTGSSQIQTKLSVYILRLVDEHLQSFIQSGIDKLKDEKWSKIIKYYLLAILSEALQSGNCEEFAAVSMVALLKANDYRSINLVGAVNMFDAGDTHAFIMLDIDHIDEIENPKQMKKATLFDVYDSGRLIHCEDKNFPDSLEKLSGIKNPLAIDELRFDKPLHADDWERLYKLMSLTREYVKILDIATLVAEDAAKQGFNKTVIPFNLNLSKIKLLDQFDAELSDLKKRSLKTKLTVDTQLVRHLNSSQLFFTGFSDSDCRVDAMAELKNSNDREKATAIQQSLRAGVFSYDKRHFILRHINLPAIDNEPSLGERIQESYSQKR